MGEIGFEQTEYTGSEGENVQPCILLFYNGNVSDLFEVDATVFRIPGTAIGGCTSYQVYKYMCDVCKMWLLFMVLYCKDAIKRIL